MPITYRYSVTDDAGTEYWLAVEADVYLGAEPVTDRLPELCHPGEPDTVELTVHVADGVELTEAEANARFGRGTWRSIRDEALEIARKDARR